MSVELPLPLRVLFLNWRAPDHPHAGGAERYVWEIAKRFAEAGAGVCLFASRPRAQRAEEARKGVRIVRQGGRFGVYVRAALFLLRERRSFDLVVDCQNGIPFFAPLFLVGSGVPVMAVIHHVHQDQFGVHFPWPLSWIGRLLEKQVARRVYRSSPTVVVSPSTREQVRRRLKLRGPVYVVPNGYAPGEAPAIPRSAAPTLAYVGRLVAHKRVDEVIVSAARLLPAWPGLRVEIAGAGPAERRLKALVRKLEIESAVHFHGRVSNQERTAILSRSWLTVNPSSGEGWGLTVIESNAVGRPCVAVRVPGLVDSIVEGVNGWLADDAHDLTDRVHAALLALGDPEEAARCAEACRTWAGRFSWDRAAARFAQLAALHLESKLAAVRAGRVTDSASVVEVEPAAGLENLVDSLPPSDLWRAEGDSLQILVQGADTKEAVARLERLGVRGVARVRAATVHELLLGLEEQVAAREEPESA